LSRPGRAARLGTRDRATMHAAPRCRVRDRRGNRAGSVRSAGSVGVAIRGERGQPERVSWLMLPTCHSGLAQRVPRSGQLHFTLICSRMASVHGDAPRREGHHEDGHEKYKDHDAHRVSSPVGGTFEFGDNWGRAPWRLNRRCGGTANDPIAVATITNTPMATAMIPHTLATAAAPRSGSRPDLATPLSVRWKSITSNRFP
jgi:hypothetical protein